MGFLDVGKLDYLSPPDLRRFREHSLENISHTDHLFFVDFKWFNDLKGGVKVFDEGCELDKCIGWLFEVL